jgi:hypothetical protein
MTTALEITLRDIQNILDAHETRLPHDMVESLYDELSVYFEEIVESSLRHSTILDEQTEHLYYLLENYMIQDGLYITEPQRFISNNNS